MPLQGIPVEPSGERVGQWVGKGELAWNDHSIEKTPMISTCVPSEAWKGRLCVYQS
jgi:hypothetical protein